MSTPLVDIPLPYGYTVGGEPGKGYQSPVDGSSYNIPLKPGPCRVMASWSGPERADFILYRNGQSTVLDTIPEKAGGGSRNSRMVTVGAIKGDILRLSCSPSTTTDATGTIEIYPLPAE